MRVQYIASGFKSLFCITITYSVLGYKEIFANSRWLYTSNMVYMLETIIRLIYSALLDNKIFKDKKAGKQRKLLACFYYLLSIEGLNITFFPVIISSVFHNLVNTGSWRYGIPCFSQTALTFG